MNLYIASIKLWFKGFKENTERSITYSFEPNKINVITGDSSTGKSSILDIIDYLLLSDNPTIVENIINENVEFYGMNIFLEERSYILMRKAPHSGQGTQDVYWKEQEEYPMPYIQTHSVGEMRTILTRMFYVPQHETKVGNRKDSMTFRHFLPFNYLTEDIISSANTYFDTAFFINRSYDVFLDYALELVNGIQYHNANEIKAKIEKAEIDLKQYQKKHQIAQENATKYKASLTSIYDDALSLNLIPADNFFVRENAHEMLHYIKEALAAYNKLIKNDEDTKKLELLKKERYELNNKLSIYNSLLAEMQKQKSSGKKIQDSLRPITFIKEHIDEVIISPETIELLHLLEKQLVQIKESRKEKPKLPHDFALRHEELKDKLKACESKLKELTILRKTIANPKWLERAIGLKYRLENLKRPKEDTYQVSTEQNMISLIESLKIEQKNMSLLPHDVKEELNSYINKYFHSINGIVDSYPDSTMRYDDDERRISLLKNGEDYPVRNIGSKSNYMFLHLCFFLGLHESIMFHRSKHVGSFLFIDQPSMPYYADKGTLDNDDKKQLIKAFRLLNEFMEEIIRNQNRSFQMILIEHADESYWKELEYFHTTATFSKIAQGGLIPKYIYE